jgi:protein TonB
MHHTTGGAEMLHVLPESSRRRSRPGGSVLASGAAHAALVVAAVWATGAGEAEPAPRPVLPGRITFSTIAPPPAPREPLAVRPPAGPAVERSAPSGPPLPAMPAVPPLGAVPARIPPVGVALANPFASSSPAWPAPAEAASGSGAGGDVGEGGEEPIPVERADVGVEALRGNPRPRYPASLERAGVAGSVTARFVIDTLGRVEPASVEMLDATHPDFERAVREVLPRLRFRPATVRGRPVRVAVLQSYEFSVAR